MSKTETNICGYNTHWYTRCCFSGLKRKSDDNPLTKYSAMCRRNKETDRHRKLHWLIASGSALKLLVGHVWHPACWNLHSPLGGCSPVFVLVWHMMTWWQLACNNIQPETFFIDIRELSAVCQHVSTSVISVWQRLTTPVSCGQWQPPSSGGWPWLTKWLSNTMRMETPDSSTMRTTGNSSSLRVICPPILALPDGLVRTTTTR